MNDMEQAKKIAAELGLDNAPKQGEKLSAMESAYRMTPNYYVEQMEKRKHAEAEPGTGAALAEDYGSKGQPESAVITRGIAVITDEIVFYKNVGGNAIIEIGKRLNEAKSQLSHGEWLDWLREKVDFSERTAQNFMRIAKEYRNPHTIADLGTAKALALLALPDSEREQFAAEKHVVNGEEKTVADMTGEELKKAIRERDEAFKRAEDAEKQATVAQENAKKMLSEETAKLDALKVKSDGLEEKLKTLRKKEQEAKAEAENARAEKAELSKQLEELKKRPVEVAVEKPSQEELDKLRAEAETAAEEKVKDANARLMAAEAKAGAAERAAEELRKQLTLADKATAIFKVHFDNWQGAYNTMLGALQEIADPGKAEKLREAIKTTLGVQEGQV